MKSLFPARPANVPPSLTKPSAAYRKKVAGVMLAILLFVFSYLCLLMLAGVLVYYGVKLGIAILLSGAGLVSILVGAGVIALAIMFFLFLVKFVVASFKDEDSSRIEITERDQPELFEFVRRVCEETGAKFPNRITISPAVNACVYYNSSFLNLFFPVRKNLEIGWPLLLSLKTVELKAVLAHEFGHFSQSSRAGVYIYTANNVIHNLVYSRDGWDKLLYSWASTGSYFGLFAVFTNWLVSGVRELLHALYIVMNGAYRALSREMEFHADSVAVSVTGSKPICDALLQLQFGNQVFASLIEMADRSMQDNGKIPANIMGLYLPVLKIAAVNHGFAVDQNGLPLIEEKEIMAVSGLRKIKVRDQMATHPPYEQRKEAAFRVPVETAAFSGIASDLIRDVEKWEKELTKRLVNKKYHSKLSPEPELVESLIAAEKRNEVHPRYKGFYHGRLLSKISYQWLMENEMPVAASEADLFEGEHARQLKEIQALEVDIEELNTLDKVKGRAVFFEYNGKECSKRDIEKIRKELEAKKNDLLDHVEGQDRRVLVFYDQHSGSMRTEYRQAVLKMEFLSGLYGKFKPQFRRLNIFHTELQSGVLRNSTGHQVQRMVNDFVNEFNAVLKDADRPDCKFSSYGTIKIDGPLSDYLAPQKPGVPMLNFVPAYFLEFIAIHQGCAKRLSILLEEQQRELIGLQDKIMGLKSV